MSATGAVVNDHAKGIDMVQEKWAIRSQTYNIGGRNEKQNVRLIRVLIIGTFQEFFRRTTRTALVSKDLITLCRGQKRDMTDVMPLTAWIKIEAEIGWSRKRCLRRA